MSNLEKILKKYDYKFPPELIAQKPAHPRDSAKLLVYDRKSKKVSYDVFKNLAGYLPPKSVLVLNDTKVLPARLPLRKATGGLVKVLYVSRKNGRLYFLSPSPLKSGTILKLNKKIYFEVKGQDGSEYVLKPSFPPANIFRVLSKYGEAPLPPYIKNSPLSKKELRLEYQSVFARVPGSIAAPTASLHFTKRLIKELKDVGIAVKYVTLHVGLGTFAPLTQENIKTGKLHKEGYFISSAAAEFLNKAKNEGRPIIAVGTTALRTLESATVRGKLDKLSGGTELFVREGDRLKFTDGLITNFHVPRSSLLMLVSSLIGRKKLFELYKLAMNKNFRLFSFGDGMLIK
ncbi:MAG: tRNA preQ1(34) S-adenosylmethionine ribosyltransferase-isomerase QueA [Candidatus Liptonbacteria bacterium]|nr:tRNA preQ1(34) S-adenosylmethionine ribosyltransferase-isomerase QueA [Candidatus Liptonbacteria bacterium]